MKKIFQGFLFSLACLIPGFSGGTMLLILGIYENFMFIISKIFKHPFKFLKPCGLFLIGMIMGCLIGTFVVSYGLEKFPFLFSSFLVGLIIETILIILKKIKQTKITIANLLCYLISLIISLFLSFNKQTIFNFNDSYFSYGYLFIISIIASATMMIPAVSGMTIFLIFDIYSPLINITKEVITGLFCLDFNPLKKHFLFLFIILLGIILGIFFISKIITKILNTKPNLLWYSILGLLISSPFSLYYKIYQKCSLDILSKFSSHLILNLFLCLVFILLGFFLLKLFNHLSKKHKNIN